MRAKEFLLEAVKRYLPMFSMFADENGVMPPWVNARIASVEKLLVRQDRVIWALRWERIAASAKYPVRGDEQAVNHRLLQDARANPSELGRELDLYQTMMRDNFAHWFSMPIKPIHDYVFDRQSPKEILDTFSALEEEWTTSRKQIINHENQYSDWESDTLDDDEDEDEDEDDKYKRQREEARERKGQISKFMDFGDGWAWWNLNRVYCNAEGGAMGHCGNSASGDPDDTVLSLRRDMGDGNFRPSLTFILNDGWLGEMKGRANEKPNAKYFPMIVSLLEDSRIEGIKGGGYASSHNFSILDLPEKVRAQLLKEKPNLLSTFDVIQLYSTEPSEENKEKLEKKVHYELRKHGFRIEGLDFNNPKHPTIIIANHGTPDQWADSHECGPALTELGEFFEELEDNLVSFTELRREECEPLVKEAYEKYFLPVFNALLYYSYPDEFALDGVDLTVRDNQVLVEVSLNDFLNPSSSWFDYDEDDDREIFDRIDSLDEGATERQLDWRDISDNVVSALDHDETAEAIAEYVFRDAWNKNSDAMLREVIGQIAKGHSDDHKYFSRHPDQTKFPFYQDDGGPDGFRD